MGIFDLTIPGGYPIVSTGYPPLMTLRLHKVTKQIDRLRENAVTRAAQQHKDLPKVEQFFQRAATLDDLPQKARLAAEKEKWNGALPTLDGITLQKAVPSLKSAPTLVAVDGSQIYPDPHEASLICAINIGYFILRPGTGEVVADSEPAIEVDEDALAPGGTLISKTVVDARRTVEEMTVLERLAAAERDARPDGAVFALSDGTLALRIDEKAVAPLERDALQKKYFAAIDRLAAAAIPVAGYIARPGRFPVLSLIDLALSPSPDTAAARSRSGRSPFQWLDDRLLFERLLPAGHRSAVFEFASDLNNQYRNREPNQSVHFFYLNVGSRYPVISRVEIPEWVAAKPALVDLVHATLIEQCSVTLNDPYPYAMIRADEEAFVSGEEKKYLEEQMAVALIRSGLRVNRSEKLSHKGRARKH
jgi:hypothetical protein